MFGYVGEMAPIDPPECDCYCECDSCEKDSCQGCEFSDEEEDEE